MLKVAMIGWEFPPFMAGGLGVHCLELTTELAKMGVDIDFYMPHMTSIEGGMRVADHHRHVRIKEIEADPVTGPYEGSRSHAYDANFNEAVMQYNARIVDAFDSHDADIIHCHDWITIPAGIELRKRSGKPLVLTMHSIERDRSADFYPQTWIENTERRGVHGADSVIAVSEYTRGLLASQYGADASRVFPVHNGVDHSKFSNHVTRDYTRSNRTVLYLSRVSRQKGPMYFVQTARKVLDMDPDARFIVAGKGEMIPEMIDYTIKHGMTDRVTFAGFVPDARLPEVYAQSDVYVLPSVSEPFGISVLEAMTSGLPAIVSKTTGVGEALTHVLKTHYWDTHEMADMILRLLDSKALREELGRNGALESRRFTWKRCGERTLDVYQRTLDGVRAGAGRPGAAA